MGSYAVVWMYKLLGYNVLPGLILAIVARACSRLLIGYISLRRSGIYFSILTLAFAQMMLQPRLFGASRRLTNGETGLQVYTSRPAISSWGRTPRPRRICSA